MWNIRPSALMPRLFRFPGSFQVPLPLLLRDVLVRAGKVPALSDQTVLPVSGVPYRARSNAGWVAPLRRPESPNSRNCQARLFYSFQTLRRRQTQGALSRILGVRTRTRTRARPLRSGTTTVRRQRGPALLTAGGSTTWNPPYQSIPRTAVIPDPPL